MSTLELVRPDTLWVPERRGSYGPEVEQFSDEHGIPLDGEQRAAIDAMASYGPGGKWVALEAVIKEGRQNGKTSNVVLPITLYDFFILPPDRICWTAHLMSTSMDTFNNVLGIIENNPDLDRRVKEISKSDSAISIVLKNGARLDFLARTRGGGRGLGGKRIVFDEALFLAEEAMSALMPTLSARSMLGNPQLVYASSAGLIDSTHLWKLTKRGRAGGDPSLVFVEFKARGGWDDPGCEQANAEGTVTCPHTYGVDGCALDRPELWRAGNHALGKRISYEYVAGERRTMTPVAFGIERLGWDLVPPEADRPISIDAWLTGDVPADAERPTGAPRFFVDVQPGMVSASIAVAAMRSNGVPHVELVKHGAGIGWIVAECKRLAATFPAGRFAGDGRGAVLTLAPKLEAAGIEVELFTVAEMATACQHLESLLPSKSHPTGRHTHAADPLLLIALGAAGKRTVSGKLWTWDRGGDLAADITPIVAETGALWLLEKYPAGESILW